MNNTGLSDDQCLSQIVNSTLGVAHVRPLNEKWTFTATLGAGIYTDLSQFSAESIMAQAGALFIRRMLPNLDLGFGVALNNVLDYPMIFSKQLIIIRLQPEIYVNKTFSIPITAGVSLIRGAYFQERSLLSFFNVDEDYPYFTTSFYASIGLQFFFNDEF
jgi:hypothetical protein